MINSPKGVIDGYPIHQIIQDAWLNVIINENKLYNPLEETPDICERPELYYSWLLTRPEYLGFAAKILLNIDLAPFQTVILQQMWKHKFPMVVASRGAGKAISPNKKVRIKDGWKEIQNLSIGEKVYASDGKLYSVLNKTSIQENLSFYKIKLRDGREIECCEHHLWKVIIDNKEFVFTTKYLFDNFKQNKYIIPHNKTIENEEDRDLSIDPYSVGKSCVIWEKSIPKEYIYSSPITKSLVLQGILDQSKNKISCKNSKLAKDITDLIRSLGFVCELKKENEQHNIKIFFPYLYKNYITKIEHIGNKDGVCISVDSPDKTYIIDDYVVTHNTFILGVYSLLRALLIPKRKIVIVGSVFRQSKLVFNYIKTIYDNSSILQSIVKDEPHFSNDRCHFTLGDSSIIGIPVGTGDKVRGLRASEILADEFACLSRNSLLQTDLGLIKVKDYLDGVAYSLLNKDREFEYPDTIFRTPPVDVYRIKTMYGFTIDCSEIHQVLTNNGWKKTLELTNKDYIKLGNNDYFPPNNFTLGNTVVDEKMSWLLGILVSEGTVTNRNFISVKNTDKELIDMIKDRYSEFNWKETYKPAYVNERGWNCKESWEIQYNDTDYRTLLKDLGVSYVNALEKEIPHCILKSSKECVLSFLNGLYEGDGTAFFCKAKRRTGDKREFQVNYYTSSIELAKQLQLVLLKFGIFSAVRSRGIMENSKNESFLVITRSNYAIKLFNMLDVIKWKNIQPPKLVKGQRDRIPHIRPSKNEKKFIVSTNVCNKNKYLGSFETKEECIEAFNNFWKNNTEFVKIESIKKLPEKEVLYDFHMPKTHSFVANGFIQHNSQSREIFETVIAGFGAVSSDPINQVKIKASQKFANHLGIELEEEVDEYSGIGNQIVLSGTAYYYFNHFAQYWEKWRKIINSKGDPKKLQEIFGDQEIDDGFDWKDYSVVRLPADLLPPGFMDSTQLARSKATLPSDIFNLEFNTIFSKDSNGFFKASLLEKCTANEENDITLPSGRVVFDAKVKGDEDKKYIIGVDPASEQDRFAVVVLEIYPDHRRIVHVWTTNSEEFKAKRKAGIIEDNDFYGYTARKIRDLMILFPCVHLAIDSQGGGKAVYEALHDTTKLKEGEVCLWEIIEPKKPKDSDAEEGLHIVEMVNFASAEYTSYANHSMKKDFEDKLLLFPRFNPAISAVAESISKLTKPKESINGVRLYDTFEDTIEEIEELKKELSQIVITITSSGRERWDTPDVKISGSQKGKLRKDRYSALVMANAAARKMSGPNYIPKHDVSNMMDLRENSEEVKFIGPQWITSKLNSIY